MAQQTRRRAVEKTEKERTNEPDAVRRRRVCRPIRNRTSLAREKAKKICRGSGSIFILFFFSPYEIARRTPLTHTRRVRVHAISGVPLSKLPLNPAGAFSFWPSPPLAPYSRLHRDVKFPADSRRELFIRARGAVAEK